MICKICQKKTFLNWGNAKEILCCDHSSDLEVESTNKPLPMKRKNFIYSDQPIDSFQEDLLNRQFFCQNVSNIINNWHLEHSYVISINGDWGSGKTSVMKLIELNLESSNIDKIHFSPWQWSNQASLHSIFFNELSTAIGIKDKSKNGDKLSKLLKTYGNYLSTGELVTNSLTLVIPGVILAATGLLSYFSGPTETTSAIITASGLLMIASQSLKKTKDLLLKWQKNIELYSKHNKKNLDEIRNTLSESLSKRDNPILIIMDDLDRLEEDQLRMLFQIIKSNLEFPNIIFVLLFQRDIVEKKLTTQNYHGKYYLEKIIQFPLNLPPPNQETISNILFERINSILDIYPKSKDTFDKNRWIYIHESCLKNYINNIRSLNRYISTLAFSFQAFIGRSSFEVNIIDLISIECIRLFEPEIYNEIKNSKDILVKQSDKSLSNGEKDHIEHESKKLLDRATSRKFIEPLVLELFPVLDSILYKPRNNYFSYSEAHMDARICHESHFNKYFELISHHNNISVSDYNDFISGINARKNLDEIIKKHIHENNINDMLSHLILHIPSFNQDIVNRIILSMIKLGEGYSRESNSLAKISTKELILNITSQCLYTKSNSEERYSIIKESLSETPFLSVIESILQEEENRRQNNYDKLIFSEDDFIKAKIKFIEKINSLAGDENHNLLKYSHFGSLVYRWERWGNSDKVYNWIDIKIDEYENCILLINHFIKNGYQTRLSSKKKTFTKTVDLKSLTQFANIFKIEKIINKHNVSEDNEVISLFNKAMKQTSV
ncbi:KAP family P-loop NTPase fold protein [Aliamphritea spongicola]|uniref:KAP family P-loop NTPase fold protein n=1 Tax=Aliamphritea spongicola TaxID=707589 RepID=UPI00196B749A|nr:P-loop NTPase fold protein [Aliamphritea spongicola]MBN3562508.1 hypothetical protein [Aliamphritea spongicola]